MTLAQTPLDKAISPSLDTCTDTVNVHTGFRGSYSAQCQYILRELAYLVPRDLSHILRPHDIVHVHCTSHPKINVDRQNHQCKQMIFMP